MVIVIHINKKMKDPLHQFMPCRSVTKGTRGARWPGRRTTGRLPKSPSNVSNFFQHSTFASERPYVWTWRCQTFFLPGRHPTSVRPSGP